MTPTTLTNLALSRIGHTLVTSLGDTTSKEARLAALHFEPCLREALRAHFWSFAMTTRPLAAVDVREYLTVTGPLKVGGTSVTFPKMYLQEGDLDGKVHYQESPDADSEAAVSGAWWDATEAEWVLEHGPLAAEWRRGLDVESPEMITLRPSAPRHFLETNLAGENNDLRFEQVDQSATPAAVEILAPVAAALTTTTVSGRVLTVTPALKSRMIVSGVASPGVNGVLYYAGGDADAHCWTSNGLSYTSNHLADLTFVALIRFGDDWQCIRHVTASSPSYICRKTSSAAFPDGLTYNSPTVGSGVCTVTAAPSTALQVVAAIEDTSPAILHISGTLSINGNPVVFPPLLLAGSFNDHPLWTEDGGPSSSGYSIFWFDTFWVLRCSPLNAVWIGSPIPATPDLVTNWVPQYDTVGTPVITVPAHDPFPTELVSVTIKGGNNGTGPVTLMPKTSLSGGVTGAPVMRRVTPGTELLGWSHAFELPADFIKAKALWSAGGRKIDQFAIRRVSGKTCILCNCDSVSLEYVQYINDPASFDPLFVKAFTTLLAAKLARAISGSDDLESRFLQIFETVDLPAARTASGHETDSDENHPLRALLDGTLTPGRGDFFPRTSRTAGGASAPAQTSPTYQTITFDTEAEQVVIRKGGKTIRINGIVDP